MTEDAYLVCPFVILVGVLLRLNKTTKYIADINVLTTKWVQWILKVL
jgi:hypothetical protein